MILVELNKLIYDFLAKGNKPEDTIIKMGVQFHREFIKACGSQINAEVGMISRYMDIQVEATHYLEPNQAAIINEKVLYDNWTKGFKLDYGEFKIPTEDQYRDNLASKLATNFQVVLNDRKPGE